MPILPVLTPRMRPRFGFVLPLRGVSRGYCLVPADAPKPKHLASGRDSVDTYAPDLSAQASNPTAGQTPTCEGQPSAPCYATPQLPCSPPISTSGTARLNPPGSEYTAACAGALGTPPSDIPLALPSLKPSPPLLSNLKNDRALSHVHVPLPHCTTPPHLRQWRDRRINPIIQNLNQFFTNEILDKKPKVWYNGSIQ